MFVVGLQTTICHSDSSGADASTKPPASPKPYRTTATTPCKCRHAPDSFACKTKTKYDYCHRYITGYRASGYCGSCEVSLVVVYLTFGETRFRAVSDMRNRGGSAGHPTTGVDASPFRLGVALPANARGSSSLRGMMYGFVRLVQ